MMFQSRTGSPGHLAGKGGSLLVHAETVSIPNGLPRPFSPIIDTPFIFSKFQFQSRTGSPGHLARHSPPLALLTYLVSIPNGLPRPFSPRTLPRSNLKRKRVSIPNGLPRPFSLNNDYVWYLPNACFNPERAPQAI